MEILPPLEEEDKMLAALSYPFWFIVSWMILLSGKKREPFVKFHAIQSLFFGASMTLGALLLIILFYLFTKAFPALMTVATGVIFIIFFLILMLLLLADLLLFFYFAFLAYNGKDFRIFIIGPYIERTFFQWDSGASEDESF